MNNSTTFQSFSTTFQAWKMFLLNSMTFHDWETPGPASWQMGLWATCAWSLRNSESAISQTLTAISSVQHRIQWIQVFLRRSHQAFLHLPWILPVPSSSVGCCLVQSSSALSTATKQLDVTLQNIHAVQHPQRNESENVTNVSEIWLSTRCKQKETPLITDVFRLQRRHLLVTIFSQLWDSRNRLFDTADV